MLGYQTKSRDYKYNNLRLYSSSKYVSHILKQWNINWSDNRVLNCISKLVML